MPRFDDDRTETSRSRRGPLLVAAAIGGLLVLMIVLHLTGVLGAKLHQ